MSVLQASMAAIDGVVQHMTAAVGRRSKTETLSLRLDPKTKFMLDFLVRVEGQSITTIVERSIRETASRVYVADDFNNEGKNWSAFWDSNEGVRTLKLISDPNYPTNFEEDELLSFTKTHWPFFFTSEKSLVPKRGFLDVIWGKIEVYLAIWRDQRNSDYWAAGKAIRADLLEAKIAPPDWPQNSKPSPQKSFSGDLDDEIPF